MFDLKRNEILREIESIIQPDSLSLERDLSIILTIGEGTGRTYGILDKIASSLAHEKINIRMLDQGSDDLNVILGVSDKDYDAAIRTLYHAMIV